MTPNRNHEPHDTWPFPTEPNGAASPFHFRPEWQKRCNGVKVFCRGALNENPGTGLLAVGVFEDERPLRGSVGLLDWRLAGRLSSFLKEKNFNVKWGESGLLLPGGRFYGTQILVWGLGVLSRFSYRRFKEAAADLTTVLCDLRTASVALPLPGLHRFPVWGAKDDVEYSDAVKDFLLAVSAAERNDSEVLLHLIEEEGQHDDILLGIHKARHALKERKITLDMIGP